MLFSVFVMSFSFSFTGLVSVRYMEPENLQKFDLPFSTHSTTGTEVPLSSKYNYITSENRMEYIHLALQYRFVLIYILNFKLCVSLFWGGLT